MKQEKKIIDYANVETYLLKVEDTLATLDDNERLLVLDFERSRIEKRKQQQQMGDLMGTVSIGGLMTKVKKFVGGEDG